MKKLLIVLSMFILSLIGITTFSSFVGQKNESPIESENTRTVPVYYNFVIIGANGAFTNQKTTGEFDADNNTIIIKGESCDVKECSYYKMRKNGYTVDDPRADYQYQAYCSSLTDFYAYFN